VADHQSPSTLLFLLLLLWHLEELTTKCYHMNLFHNHYRRHPITSHKMFQEDFTTRERPIQGLGPMSDVPAYDVQATLADADV